MTPGQQDQVSLVSCCVSKGLCIFNRLPSMHAALALMLCAGIYLIAHTIYRSTIVPPGPKSKSCSTAAALPEPFASPTDVFACLQALAVMLCAGIYLLAHSIYRVIVVPPGQEGEVTLVCCGVPMQEERREKLVTQMSKVKSRCKCISCTLPLLGA